MARSQSLRITDFGPLKECSLALNELILLMGPQASGKSTLAKLIHLFLEFCKSLPETLIRHTLPGDRRTADILALSERLHRQLSELFPWHASAPPYRLHFDYTETIGLTVSGGGASPTRITPTSDFSEVIRALGKMAQKVRKMGESPSTQYSLERKLLTTDIERKVARVFGDIPSLFFVPAGRSALSVIPGIHIIDASLDPLTRRFLNDVHGIRALVSLGIERLLNPPQSFGQGKVPPAVAELAAAKVASVLKGSYRFYGEDDRIYLDDERYVHIKSASSGQQESLWILLMAYVLMYRNEQAFLVVEEPEAHLHPAAQKAVMELLVMLFNQGRTRLVMSTHSPYVVEALNYLMMAHTLGKKKILADEVNSVIPMVYWLDPSHVSALYVNDGTLTDIVDRQTASIAADGFNEVFGKTSLQYGALRSLAFK